MKRFMMLEGVKGLLVTDPYSGDALRYVGQVKKSYEECQKASCFVECFDPEKAVKEYHPYLVKAVSRGSLKQFGNFVYAESADEALASISSKPKPKPKKAETSKEKGNE
jgi:hypothetical protein